MSLANFRSYQLAVQFYREATQVKLPYHLHDQFLRAASSIALNLAEGSAKGTPKDRTRFYRIALGSQRECSAVLDLVTQPRQPEIKISGLCDQLGAHLYKLVHSS